MATSRKRKEGSVAAVQEMPGPKSPVERRKATQPILTDVEQMEHNGHIVDRTIETVKGGWRQDLSSITLLLVLYTLQGIPMGLSGSIPFLLVDKVSYSEQAVFSLVSTPFSLKLLWAPLVDSLYFPSFGRRKSWLVPAQLLCGGMMLSARSVMDEWIGEDGGVPHVKTLTAYFLALYFIMATQDIAVDGWALTMLSRENVGFASTCNTIGQTLGFFISQVGFLALYDPGVCNKYFRSEPSDVGIVTLSTFLQFWGAVFLATTIWLCLFKPEVENGVNDEFLGLVDTYKQLYKCVQLPSVRSFSSVLLTCRMAFAVTDAATSLKLVEYGMPKEEIAMLSPILVALGMIIPVAVGRITAGSRPMTVFLWGYPLRIAVTLMYLVVLPLSRKVYMMPGGDREEEEGDDTGGDDTAKFFGWLITAVVLHEVAMNCMFVSQMAFCSRVSDPGIGGTYMTLLNTIGNVGGRWPNSLSLYLLEKLTFSHCVTEGGDIVEAASCATDQGKQLCTGAEGSCVVWLDGYTVQAWGCTLIGLIWLGFFARRVQRMQDLPAEAWIVSTKSN
ncbi:unnamed protein product [Ectocarpus sp. CCAP 1310/34]|nr:unnamed protein product [Ectocarpus sp. CCAP 1310/34]